jgi:N-acyl homoserine lactone hydrolase
MNTSAEQTQASFKRVADLIAEKKARLWINHDKPQSLSQKQFARVLRVTGGA